MNLPVLRRRQKVEVVDRPSDEAFKAAVGAFAKAVYQEDGELLKAFLDGNAAKMPGSSWSNQGTINNALIARVTQNLASSFNRAPEELEMALAEHGLSWGPPFPPGRPLDPFWGYRRPPRTWNYSVGENVQLTPRWNRISFPTLKSIIESYYAAQICVRHLINDVRSLDYQFIPPQNVLEDATEDIQKAEEFFASPDKRQPFRAWLAEYLQDVLRYDAGALYIRRNEAHEPIALEVVSGSTIIPLIDFFGRPPADEDDSTAVPEGIWEGDVTPAFTQIVEGLPWVWLAKEDLIYQPLNPLPESQYGLAPMEAVLLQANCFSADTEVLTARGWLRFPDVDLGTDEIATRNPKTQAFEWQQPTKAYEAQVDEPLYHFTAKSVDMLVTAGHRMLVDRCPKNCPSAERWGDGWRIQAEELAAVPYSAGVRMLLTSEWDAPDLERFCIDPEGRNRKGFAEFSGDDFAAFMGMWLAEGSATYQPGRYNEVTVSQRKTSRGFGPYKALLERVLGRCCLFNGDRFRFHNAALALYLAQFGNATEKFIPGEVLGMSRRQLQIFWDFYYMGDGTANGSVPWITTSSKRMADGLQEVAQKIGQAASVRPIKPAPEGRVYKGRLIRENAPRWKITLSNAKTRRFRVERLPYTGKVYCVSVPNRVIYVRRNGHAVWCGQTDIRFQWHFLQMFTEGTVPAGFMEAPPDLSDPSQVQEWQETFDAVMMGDQSKQTQIRWVPAGAAFTPLKPTIDAFDDAFPLYLMRCTAAAFGVTPNDLGFTEDVNRSVGETQVNIQFRVGTMPIVRHVEDIINLFLLEHLKLKARIAFDTGQGTQHRYEIAQANDIYLKNGTLSSDEVRLTLGKRISRERPTPRFVDNTRAGPIPLLALESVAGDIDPTTYGPAKTQKPVDMPFISAPGAAPVIGSDDYKAAQDSTASGQRALISETTGGGMFALPPPPTETAKTPTAKEIAAELAAILKGVDNTGGPGVTRGFSNPTTITDGITVDTDLQGVDLIGPKIKRKAKPVDEEVEKSLVLIRQWRENALNRVKKGQPPRRFDDIPAFIADRVWFKLCAAETREQVIEAFSGDFLADPVGLPKAEARKGLDRVAAGIALQAQDTGRVLLVQRTPDKHDDRGAYARWEFPGGRLDDTDPSVWAAAVREWQEETGATLPVSARAMGGWLSDDGDYEGFVVTVPSEDDLELDPQPEEVSQARWCDTEALDDPRVRDKVQEQLDSIRPALKAKWEDFHHSTDKILEHYTPLIRDAMANIVEGDTVRHAMRVAYGDYSEKSLPTAPGSNNTPKYEQALQALTGLPQGTPVGQALAALLGTQAGTSQLMTVLTELYGEAILQGTQEASQAAGVPSGIPLPDTYWSQWEPGQSGAAAQLAGEGLSRLLQQAEITIRGIAETEVNRIGEAIAQGVRDGFPMPETAARVDEIIHDADRAKMVAETEFARASGAARRATYVRNGVPEVGWLHQPGACPRCLENASVSPIPITASWPEGDVPVHPWCRCVEVPVVRVPGRS